MNKYKGLSKIQKIIVLIVLGILILTGGTASAYVIKNQYNSYQEKRIYEAANEFEKTKAVVTSNVDLNDVDKLDKNSTVTITVPIPQNSKYDYYYDDRKAEDSYPDYKKIKGKWKKTIKIADLPKAILGTEYYDLNDFLLKKKGDKDTDIVEDAHISDVKLPIDEENIDSFEGALFKLKADKNGEKYTLNQYLEKHTDEPIKVSGTVQFEDGSYDTYYVENAKDDIFNQKFYGADYEPDEESPAKVYYQKLYMIDEKTGMKINLVYTAYYYAIDYYEGYEGKKIENDIDDAKEKATQSYTNKINAILEENPNKFLSPNNKNTISAMLVLSDGDKKYDADTNTVEVGRTSKLIIE